MQESSLHSWQKPHHPIEATKTKKPAITTTPQKEGGKKGSPSLALCLGHLAKLIKISLGVYV